MKSSSESSSVLHVSFCQLVSFIVVVLSDRIIAMCGDYYIGGRRFSSLSDLIGYYSYVSCLLKGEKLLSPVAPPEVRLTPSLGEYSIFQHIVVNSFQCFYSVTT